ncbi:hypothetical protein QO002_005389 [Pararhizobium capsulatum DSM 1112]|uniref:Uncharacterized protein n=1 Tax=Pararhizobium capsulatum DSM 1112 TaxID=1121113 RepID=A0ABU0BZ00_9HYPH|nr:hypothetical protein [Pararhizobium capsulatum]MDQ0323183.1 hypothetical protein [Pararhizobium capsulatum DSM 1112]
MTGEPSSRPERRGASYRILAIQYVNSPQALAAFILATIAAVTTRFGKDGNGVSLRDLPPEHRLEMAKDMFAWHKESQRFFIKSGAALVCLIVLMGAAYFCFMQFGQSASK